MAMFPNATRGYMPFVSGQHRPSTSKRGPRESRKKGTAKAYRVTLKDRQGFTYTYIIQADGTKSLPSLCGTKVTMNGQSLSLPDIDKYLANSKASRPAVDSGKKQGLFSSILKFLSNKTKSKSKRKPKPLPQRKRQRTISNISNLDPIQESPDEYEDEDSDDDAESSSYTHEEGSLQGDIESIHEDINTLILTQP